MNRSLNTNKNQETISGVTPLRRASLTIKVSAVALVTALLVGCSALPQLRLPSNITGQMPAAAVTPAPGQSAAPPVDSPTKLDTTTTKSNASSATTDAIKSVIQRGNQEEVQALASQDPTVMRDTSTAAYYDQLAQSLGDLVNSGVTAIQLANINWGAITMQGTTGAQATTVETWRTTFADGSTMQETNTNVYTLVLQGGTWLVQDDQQTNGGTPGNAAGNPAAPTPVTPATPAAPTGAAQSHSSNWSGYDATGGTFTAVSGSWTVPQVSAGASGADATWVGIGGVKSHDLIQAGTQAVVQSGRVVYTAWWETLPQVSQPVPLNISAGDTVSVSIAQQSGSTWLVDIVDTTTGDSFRKTVTYQSSLSSAEWVEESPSAGGRLMIPLDNFGAVNFTNATTVENGQQRTVVQAGAKPVTMYDQADQALAQPSVVGADGASFTVSRTSVPASTGFGPSTRRPRNRYTP